MSISTIHGLQRYLKYYSGFSAKTINSVIIALGYNPLHATKKDFIELSGILLDCSNHGANIGFTGFSYYSDTVKFFKKHQIDIVSHLEKTAVKLGVDLISFILNFKEFRTSDDPPTPSNVGKALWDKSKTYPELTELYNAFSWYTLKQLSIKWYAYLFYHPDVKAKNVA